MLSLSAKKGDVIWIYDDCDVIKLRYNGQNEWSQASLGVRAPHHMTVLRDKLITPEHRQELNDRLESGGD